MAACNMEKNTDKIAFQHGSSISINSHSRMVRDISFREAVRDIPSTTHGTFSIYQYPAKFIPQVIAYVIKHHVESDDPLIMFDPFAGHGTTGIVARLYGHHYELWDLNPLLEIIHDTAIMSPPREFDPLKVISAIKKHSGSYLPKWKNLTYWHPQAFLSLLSRAWSYAHSLPSRQERLLLYIPLVKVSRYFSWADENVHKLYKSRRSKNKIHSLLETNWKDRFYSMLKRELDRLIVKLCQYRELNPRNDVNAVIRAGVDVIATPLDHDVDVLITSTPYLQAQEYIRSTKLALYWLGYDDAQIRDLTRKEIPYRHVSPVEIHSELFHVYRDRIKEDRLKLLFDNYFHAILGAFTTFSEHTRRLMAIFVSPATIRTIPIPIDDIFRQHLESLGWKHVITYIDTIKVRTLFESRINPASGLRNQRMQTEHLLILQKPE